MITSNEKVSNAALWQTCPEIKNEDVFWVKHGHQQNAKWTRCGKYNSILKAIFFSAFYGIRLFGHLIQAMLLRPDPGIRPFCNSVLYAGFDLKKSSEYNKKGSEARYISQENKHSRVK